MDLIKTDFNSQYPSTADLKNRARKRIPKFAFDYLEGGCNEDVNLQKNKMDIQQVELMPQYFSSYQTATLSTELFGHTYSAPFGIAPIGLQGLIWPDSPKILARAAKRHNIPFILSTVTTAGIEEIAEITEGNFWFQLYHPAEEKVTKDILQRAEAAGCKVLVILADVPTFGFRPRDIRNGLAMPPHMSLKNFVQMTTRPGWALRTLKKGQPQFASLLPYIPKNLNLKQLGHFMNQTFDGRLSYKKVEKLRSLWKGKIVIKGLVNESDVEKAIAIGLDGIIVSNHGGRQLDPGQSTIVPLSNLASKYNQQIPIMMDSGIRSGPDIARVMAHGARFTFMGRPFMYGVGALGRHGGNHTIAMLKLQLQQVMEQLGCEQTKYLPQHLIND